MRLSFALAFAVIASFGALSPSFAQDTVGGTGGNAAASGIYRAR